MNEQNETFGAEEEEVAEKTAEKIAAPKKKNMFAAFKDEYDKARNGD